MHGIPGGPIRAQRWCHMATKVLLNNMADTEVRDQGTHLVAERGPGLDPVQVRTCSSRYLGDGGRSRTRTDGEGLGSLVLGRPWNKNC